MLSPLIQNQPLIRYQYSDMLDGRLEITHPDLHAYLVHTCSYLNNVEREYETLLTFLMGVSKNVNSFNRYRNELERFHLWAWEYKKTLVKNLESDDLTDYFDFIFEPPQSWKQAKQEKRFVQTGRTYNSNLLWRPFSSNRKFSKQTHSSSYTILNAYLNELLNSKIISVNPIPELRKRDKKIKGLGGLKTLTFDNNVKEKIVEQLFLFSGVDVNKLRNLFIYLLIFESKIPLEVLRSEDDAFLTWQNIILKGDTLYLEFINSTRSECFILTQYASRCLNLYKEQLGLVNLESANSQPLFHKTRGTGGYEVRQLRRLVKSFKEEFCNEFSEWTVLTLDNLFSTSK